MRRLIARGLARPGPFGIGLDVRPDLSVVGDGPAMLWTLGPLIRGAFWECTAVPDIRNQAAQLARAVVLPDDAAEQIVDDIQALLRALLGVLGLSVPGGGHE